MSAALQASAAWEASFLGAIYKQKIGHVPPIPAHIDLKGQAAIVTGANSGLGLECSRQLLKLHLSHLVIGVRSQAKGDAVAAQLRGDFPDARVEVEIVDMESYGSVRGFAARCQRYDQLDLAILNAGLVKAEFTRSGGDNGHETIMQVNYLSTALLAILLLPVLKGRDGKSARLTLVGSDTGLWVTPEAMKGPSGSILFTMDSPEAYHGFDRYSRTKGLVFMFLSKLADRVQATDVVINAVNPSGVAGTGIGREATSWMHYFLGKTIDLLFSRDINEGTRKYLHTALVLGEESHGSVADHIIRPYPPLMYTDTGRQLMDQLWDETMKELAFADVEAVLKRMEHE